MITQHGITFYLHEQEISFELVNED
jgi:serine/threonine protein kinase